MPGSPSAGLCILLWPIRYWLGLRMFQDEVQFPVCHAVADPFGDHHVGCGGNGDRILRHNTLRDAVFSAAQSAALVPRREVPSLIPNSHSWPADIFLPSWKRGQPAALDVAVIMQQAMVNGAGFTQGHTLLFGEARKTSADEALCAATRVTFVPIVMETLGGMSALTVDTLASLGCLLEQRLGVNTSDSVRHLFQSFSISIWREMPLMATSVTSLGPLSGWSLLTFLFLSLPFLCVLYFLNLSLFVYFYCVFFLLKKGLHCACAYKEGVAGPPIWPPN